MGDEFNMLIVEDDDSTYNVISAAFSDKKYKLWRVGTAKEALNLIKDVYFIAVISELRIADMDGNEFIQKAKKIDSRTNVIVLTVYSFADSAVEALKAGAYAYILKPLNPEELKLMLRRSIENTCLLIQAGRKQYFQDMSMLDGLTRVYNHRHFHEVLDWHMNHIRRFPQAFSLFIIDVDDFKEYNDVNGHVAGDKVLYNVAQLFVALTRDEDVVFRYGGEEFAVIMPQTTNQQAQIVGQRLVDGTKKQSPVTISLGLSTFPDDAQEKKDLIAHADKALYRAKRLGKDRMCVHDKNSDR